MCCIYTFHILRDFIFLTLSVFIIIYSFKTRHCIKELNKLKINTNFTEIIPDNLTLNPLEENSYLKEENNVFIEFFNKYNLNEGDIIVKNEKIKSTYDHLNRISLTYIIILIIFCIPPIILFIFILCVKLDSEGFIMEFYGQLTVLVIILKFIIVFILTVIYIIFEVIYKNYFENEFFELFNSIEDSSLNNSFKTYYQVLFDLKKAFTINIILLAVNLILIVGLLIFFFDPCECLWKKWYF
jgi:hypothetical protein